MKLKDLMSGFYGNVSMVEKIDIKVLQGYIKLTDFEISKFVQGECHSAHIFVTQMNILHMK